MSLFITIPNKIAYYATSKVAWKVARKSSSISDAEKQYEKAVKQNLKTFMHPVFQE